MEFKSLLLGILFSVGIFAVKGGVGLHYLLQRGMRPKITAALLFLHIGGYLSIFCGAFYLLEHFDFLRQIELVLDIMKSGMTLHVIMAIVMAAYGFALLKRSPRESGTARGWMLLVLPCPLCLTVILFSAAFLSAFFPAAGKTAVLATGAGFLLTNFLTVLLMKVCLSKSRQPPESVLGAAMLMISSYFLLSVVIMPQFGDIDKIYRLALYQGKNIPVPATSVRLSAGVVLAAFTAGFTAATQTMRRTRN